MTATEVIRNFSAVLDSVEAGGEIAITRGKRVVARINPEKMLPNGAALIAFLEKWQAEHAPMDEKTYTSYKEILDFRHGPKNQATDPSED